MEKDGEGWIRMERTEKDLKEWKRMENNGEGQNLTEKDCGKKILKRIEISIEKDGNEYSIETTH